jgi:hypothetical protein
MDLQAALAELEGIEDDDLRDAMAFLVKKGLIIDSGKRRNGLIVWVANPIFLLRRRGYFWTSSINEHARLGRRRIDSDGVYLEGEAILPEFNALDQGGGKLEVLGDLAGAEGT